MDLRYATRRFLLALALAGTLNALLTGLLCPVIEVRIHGAGHYSWDSRVAVFVPIWEARGRALAKGWLLLQATGSLFIGFGFWFVYPQFRPPPPPR